MIVILKIIWELVTSPAPRPNDHMKPSGEPWIKNRHPWEKSIGSHVVGTWMNLDGSRTLEYDDGEIIEIRSGR